MYYLRRLGGYSCRIGDLGAEDDARNLLVNLLPALFVRLFGWSFPTAFRQNRTERWIETCRDTCTSSWTFDPVQCLAASHGRMAKPVSIARTRVSVAQSIWPATWWHANWDLFSFSTWQSKIIKPAGLVGTVPVYLSIDRSIYLSIYLSGQMDR